ncbi:thioesterase family protein [Xylophilus sp. GOD-11R]|uniref:acyl-CoA thioesterase n=1 Tax=Xylophilus sp. GOD-11R TaxID=3089814 RepID=UPI00298D2F96|nr:thioesterase family protein [Xylophilus sp. GOD-11R]WPB57810.1 thioesterase family protein [Xylophilus sp. GOD-11R]
MPCDPPTESLHPLDQTTALQSSGPHHWRGQPGKLYWNMVGPFGGTTAATLLHGVLLHPERIGEPAALTVNYAAPLADAPFLLEARPLRTNRSSQHWFLSMTQTDAQGATVTVASGTAVTALRRDTWSGSELPLPPVQPFDRVRTRTLAAGFDWTRHYDLRMLDGDLPEAWDGGEAPDSVTRLWIRDQPPRPLDFLSLTAMSDLFYPRVWRRRAHRTPAGTVSITVYFHADQPALDAAGSGPLLGEARGQEFRHGFFDQRAQLWSADGTVMTTTHQLVYYRD